METKETIKCPVCKKDAPCSIKDDWYYCLYCNSRGKPSTLKSNIDCPDFLKDLFGFK